MISHHNSNEHNAESVAQIIHAIKIEKEEDTSGLRNSIECLKLKAAIETKIGGLGRMLGNN